VFGYHRLEPALAGQVRAADAPGGELNLFVCRRCGLAQWYAAFPDKIPIAAELGTRLLRGPEPAGPYR
jgi:hypothetical protein